MTDPYVDMLDAEYRELKAQLHRCAAKFEALQTQYRRESNQIADAITQKWIELQKVRAHNVLPANEILSMAEGLAGYGAEAAAP